MTKPYRTILPEDDFGLPGPNDTWGGSPPNPSSGFRPGRTIFDLVVRQLVFSVVRNVVGLALILFLLTAFAWWQFPEKVEFLLQILPGPNDQGGHVNLLQLLK